MTDFDYYKAPSDEIFDEIKEKAIELWETYDDTYGYATEKVNRIRNIKNIQDNAWYIVAMFDYQNQARLLFSLSGPAKDAVSEVLMWSRQQV